MQDLTSYPKEKFPSISLNPKVEARHSEHSLALNKAMKGYLQIGHRSVSHFDWILRVLENTGLSTVRSEYLDSLCVTKTKLVLFTTLLDDTVDSKQKRNLKLLEEVLKIPFTPECIKTEGFSKRELEYLTFTQEIWTEIINELKTYPNFEKYREMFVFDTYQLLNSMRYSRFVNTMPNATNKLENTIHVHHGMLVLLQSDFDLMCSQNFDDGELGKLRTLLLIIQKLVRIGNLYSTYTREILEEDASSELVSSLRQKFGDNFLDGIYKTLNKERRYPLFEQTLQKKWKLLYKKAICYAQEIKSIDTNMVIKQTEFVQAAYMTKADHW